MRPTRPRGRRYSLPLFAFTVAISSVLVTAVQPPSTASATTVIVIDEPDGTTQSITVQGNYEIPIDRDGYGVTKRAKPKPAAASPSRTVHVQAAAAPSPGTAQAIAHGMVLDRGWDEGQYSCLVALWNRESHWNVHAYNASSGAYGIPQAVPGNKMASAGPDWRNDATTQIAWGLSYIKSRYATPCGAWAHSQAVGWY